jgi:hypothetical protein
MRGRFQLTTILILFSLAGSPGCRRSEPAAPGIPPAGTATSESAARSSANPGILARLSSTVLAVHFRGAGYLGQDNLDSAAEAFREVHSPVRAGHRGRPAIGRGRGIASFVLVKR